MPKPLKKATPKKKAAKRRSTDAKLRANQMIAQQMEKIASVTSRWAKDFEPAGMTVTFGPEVEHEVLATPSEMEKFDAMYRAKMAALGAKGGKIGGKRRLETLSGKRRTDIATKAAAARWAKKKRPSQS